MNKEEFLRLLRDQVDKMYIGKPWDVCAEGVWCKFVNTTKCASCKRVDMGEEDHFAQDKQCFTYSFRPNGYWPRDHPERMEMDEMGNWR